MGRFISVLQKQLLLLSLAANAAIAAAIDPVAVAMAAQAARAADPNYVDPALNNPDYVDPVAGCYSRCQCSG